MAAEMDRKGLLPCPICLGMSNVYRIPADTPIQYARELEPQWLANKHLEALTARKIGSARRPRSQERTP